MLFDITDRVAEAHDYYDKLLDERLEKISELAEVPRAQLIKINPADFAERNRFQLIRGYKYRDIAEFIASNKRDDTFLISPLDAIEETAAQISYKAGTEIRRTLRASKCDVLPCPIEFAQDFFIRNHRQSPPLIRHTAVCFSLVFKGEVVAVMLYDISDGAVRGNKKEYELVRLSISRGTRIHGGASKLQQACEDTLRQMNIADIYSYSNATINNGGVYEKLGFDGTKISGGQPHVIKKDNEITRLINLYPHSTDEALALRGWIKVHLGGNRTWKKTIIEGTRT